jgi:XTP/dITP diphosphohydrolase
MTTTLLLATKNAGKIREFRALFWDLPKLIVKPADEVVTIPDVDEDGRTFEENAAKKAREIARVTGHLVLADDSGLEVDALGGRPGVYSARYAGRHGDDEGNNDKLLLELAGVPDEKRGARYRVVLALADPQGPLAEEVHLETGVCEGVILRVRRGQNGFGYDPVFAPKAFDKTMAELSPEEKNEISHRAEAAAKMRKFLGDYLAQRRAAKNPGGAEPAGQPPAATKPRVTAEAAGATEPEVAERVKGEATAVDAAPSRATRSDKAKAESKKSSAREKAAGDKAAGDKPAGDKAASDKVTGEKAPPARRGKPRVA